MQRDMLLKHGFTLTELMVVVIIVGVMAAFALPDYALSREKALDKEVIANLRAIRTANKHVYMQMEIYWPPQGGGWVTNMAAINGNLTTDIPANNWVYQIHTTGNGQRFDCWAQRTGPTGTRTWKIDESVNEPTCTGACL